MATPNHFTCTLGQAIHLNEGKSVISNINELIEHKAKESPSCPVLCFPNPKPNGLPWTIQSFTFQDVLQGSCNAADYLVTHSPLFEAQKQTVALLCPSSVEFVFIWLGLIRLGHSVLLLAPECKPNAIAHLIASCNVHILLYDSVFEAQAENARRIVCGKVGEEELSCILLGLNVGDDLVRNANFPLACGNESSDSRDGNDIAYYHHTSGTSSGLPKPIPQTHRSAVGVLPQTLDGSKDGVFTTTPMYHGGPADLFRAWTSNAMVCMFPGRDAPITASNVLKCLQTVSAHRNLPPITCFSSVPYVLQMMAADHDGLKQLQSMNMVGVGGAALPTEVGEQLVAQNVNLVSRYGSAECGFLISSHRNYEKDRAWQYLRVDENVRSLKFEERDDGNVELIVLSGWPHMAKVNRPGGSYATSDLFTPHHSIPNAWRYHSRADSQLTLITGKKFDPAPIESSIATSTLINDVLIFGDGRPFPGAILFPSYESQSLSSQEIVNLVSPTIERVNIESPKHARIGRNMLVVMPYGENRLEKSSKGTLMRNKAVKLYEKEILQAYESLERIVGGNVPDDRVSEVLSQHISDVTGNSHAPAPDTQLFSYGVDSVASIQIRYFMQQLLPKDTVDLPLSIVEDCGTTERLKNYVIRRRHGQNVTPDDELELMPNLVEEYGAFREDQRIVNFRKSDPNGMGNGYVLLLTGATGALGAHLLNIYRYTSNVSQIYLLVRGADDHAVRERVEKSLILRGLPSLSEHSSDSNDRSTRITILRTQLSSPKLGLEDETYSHLCNKLTHIIHAAWSVNFRQRLPSFVKDHIRGTRHLLDLAIVCSKQPKFAFISSLASVAKKASVKSSTGTYLVPENISTEPRDASPLGYGRSKWVTEAMLSRAVLSCPSLKGRISVYRVGQLTGDTDKGIWSASEAWPLFLKSSTVTGVLPDLSIVKKEELRWLAVDIAARGIVQGTLACKKIEQSRFQSQEHDQVVDVFHVLNDASPAAQWTDLLGWMKKLEPDIRVVSPGEWLQKMQNLQDDQPDYPALKLLGLWRDAYGGKHSQVDQEDKMFGGGSDSQDVQYDTERAKSMAPCLRYVQGVDEEHFSKLWKWIKENV